MNSVGSSNKGSIMKQLAILLSIVMSILHLSACGLSDAPDTLQSTADMVMENNSTQAPTGSSREETEPGNGFVETNAIDDETIREANVHTLNHSLSA